MQAQVAVVTGGGRGLGRAFAKALADAGARVAVLARSAGELEETVSLIESANGTAQAFSADVSDSDQVRRTFDEIEQSIGPIDLLVNNAGVLGPIGPFWERPFEDFWRTMEVNLRGAMLCVHTALPGMVARRRGRIINVATGAAPLTYLSSYLASKMALVRAAECIAAEVKPYGIAVFSIAPGTVETAMTHISLHSADGQKWIPWFRRIFDEGMTVPPERPAELVVKLASGEFDALTGLYLTPFDDLQAVLQEEDRVHREQLHSLRVRPLNATPLPPGIAAIRQEAEQARPISASSRESH